MKKMVWILVVLFFACKPDSDSAPSTSSVAVQPLATPVELFYRQYDQDARNILVFSHLLRHSPAMGWRKDLSQLKPYVERELPALKGKTLHVVLQAYDESAEEMPLKEVVAGQEEILNILKRLRPKLLVAESFYFDTFSRQRVIEEQQKTATELGLLFSDEITRSPEELYDLPVRQNAALLYASKHPECHVVGGEWRGVDMLNFVARLPDVPPAVSNTSRTGSRIRSWNMAARAGEFMRRNNLTEGTIVVSRNHLEDFMRLEKLFGVQVIVHDPHNRQ